MSETIHRAPKYAITLALSAAYSALVASVCSKARAAECARNAASLASNARKCGWTSEVKP